MTFLHVVLLTYLKASKYTSRWKLNNDSKYVTLVTKRQDLIVT